MFQKVLAYVGGKDKFSNCVTSMLDRFPRDVSSTKPLHHSEAMNLLNNTTMLEDFISHDSGEFFLYGNHWCGAPVKKSTIKDALIGNATLITRSGGSIVAISFRSLIPAKVGTKMEVFYYGSGMETFFAHIAGHIKHMLSRTTGETLGVIIHFPICLDLHQIESYMTNIVGSRFYFDNEKDLTDVLILTIPMQFKTGLNGAYTDTLLPLAKL